MLTGGAEGEELVGVNGDVTGVFGGSVFQGVASQPVVFAGGGEGFDGFAEVAGAVWRMDAPLIAGTNRSGEVCAMVTRSLTQRQAATNPSTGAT